MKNNLPLARRILACWPYFLIILFLIGILWVVESSQAFQDCIQDNQQRKDGHQAEKSQSKVFIAVVLRYGRAVGCFVDKENPAVTASATLIIAFFTGTLWFATIRQGRITQIALRADRPFLLSGNVKLESNHASVKSEREDVEPFVFISSLQIEFTNYGKGPALIKEVVGTFDLATRQPRHPNQISWGHLTHNVAQCPELSFDRDVIGPEASGSVRTFKAHLSMDSYQQILKSQDELIVFGRVDYTDVFEHPYFTEFCKVVRLMEKGYFSDEELSVEAEIVDGPRDHNRHS